ncbi:MAG: phosphohistidine phosphatase SixA [Roseiflexaceae bacterium]|nr:phosphohistidine phosphatase SixA [Roseiflexaceae bacterium]
MELYFVRHGLAGERKPGDPNDAARPLTEQGIEKMRGAAGGLRRLGVAPEALLSSPFTRAHQTAEIIAAELGLSVQLADQLASGCDLAALQRALAAFTQLQRVMVVGHEPDFSEMIDELTGGRVEIKKGAVCRVDLATVVPGGGTLIWLLPAKVLRGLSR